MDKEEMMNGSSGPHNSVIQTSWNTRPWLNLVWVIFMVLLLIYGVNLYRSGWLCHHMGVDFRGYYASAQIARQYGFEHVYDSHLQYEAQTALRFRCADTAIDRSPPIVFMPYLPVFVLFFLPLTLLDFTVSYYLWVIVNIIVLVVYVWRYSIILGSRVDFLRVMQWVICIPVISNLFLGQMNLWLLICVGELARAYLNGRSMLAGLWLGGLLLKPQTLILAVPAFVLRKHWKLLSGFMLALMFVVCISYMMVGTQGLVANAILIYKFAGPLIETAAYMMNIRAGVLNLQQFLPPGFSLVLGITAGCLVILAVMRLWQRFEQGSSTNRALLLLATFAGTFMVTWHSHFYLLICLIPILILLDEKRMLSMKVQGLWFLAPFALYGIISMIAPEFTRNLFGIGMFTLNLLLLIWADRSLSKYHSKPVNQ